VTLVDVVELATYTIRTFLVTRVRIIRFSDGFVCCRPDGLELTSDRVSQSVRRFWRL